MGNKFNAFKKYQVAYLVDSSYSFREIPFRWGEFLVTDACCLGAVFMPDKSGAIPTWWEFDGDVIAGDATEVTLNMLQWSDGSQYCVFVSVATPGRVKVINDLAVKGMLMLCNEQGVSVNGTVLYTKYDGFAQKKTFSSIGSYSHARVQRIPAPEGQCDSTQEKEPYEQAVVKLNMDGICMGQFFVEWLGDIMNNPAYTEALMYRFGYGSKVTLTYMD